MGLGKVAALKEKRILTAIEGLASLTSNPVSQLVADNCTQNHQWQERFNVHDACCGKNTGGDQKGIAGKEKTDKESRLDENNQADQGDTAPVNQSLNVVDTVQQLRN